MVSIWLPPQNGPAFDIGFPLRAKLVGLGVDTGLVFNGLDGLGN